MSSITTTIPKNVVRIAKLSQLTPALIGQCVKLHGWIYSTRTQGAGTLAFLDLGDGSTVTPTRCMAQKPKEDDDSAVVGGVGDNEDGAGGAYGSTNLLLQQQQPAGDEAGYRKLSFDELTQSSSLSTGCSVMMFGSVVAPPAGTSQTLEVKVTELFLIGGVQDASKYPIQKSILKKPTALRSVYHARFRAPLVQQLMRIRSETLFAIHEFFHQQGVPLLDRPIAKGPEKSSRLRHNSFHPTNRARRVKQPKMLMLQPQMLIPRKLLTLFPPKLV